MPFPSRERARVLMTGGAKFRDEFLKRKMIGLVELKTTEADHPIAYLLRNDEANQVRIGVFSRRMGDHFQPERRGQWQVLAVPRSTILSMIRKD